MASAPLQLKAFGVLSCRRLHEAHPVRRGRIQGSSFAFLVRRETLRGLSSRRGRRVSMRRRWVEGADPVMGLKANPEETTSCMAVEDKVEDTVEVGGGAAISQGGRRSSEHPGYSPGLQFFVLELLRTKRAMTFNEVRSLPDSKVRLTVMIEDPRDVKQRRLLDIEDDRGCSMEEVGNALAEAFSSGPDRRTPGTRVYEGRIPKDRVTMRGLTEEMLNWSNLEVSSAISEADLEYYSCRSHFFLAATCLSGMVLRMWLIYTLN